jgi:hypothetical protein
MHIYSQLNSMFQSVFINTVFTSSVTNDLQRNLESKVAVIANSCRK